MVAAKSTKSVAVPDAQIVAALCPLPRTMNLNYRDPEIDLKALALACLVLEQLA